MKSMRFFNTEGPVRADDHYCIPPLERVDLDEMLELVRSKKYFVLHAPRQTGKTSALPALRDVLNGGAAGDYRCVSANFEVGQAGREDTARAMRAMLGELARRAHVTLGDDTPHDLRGGALESEGPDGALIDVLWAWSRVDPRPLVLLIDEILRRDKFVVECKLRRRGLERTIEEGLSQTQGYMDRCGAESGHLIVFDRSPERSWADKVFRRKPAANGAPVTVWGM